MIEAHETLGQVATSNPAATRVFLRHGLDFCCGGGRKLSDACRAAGLDPGAVVAEIEQESSEHPAQRWDNRPLPELVEFILTRYHEPLRRDLPGLIDAAKKVERVHGKKPSCPVGLAELLVGFQEEITQHLAKEEQVLFPAIEAGVRGASLHPPVRVLTGEHDEHGENLGRLRELVTDFQPPPEACATWRALYAGLERLEAELMEHIHLENNILFPRALAASAASAATATPIAQSSMLDLEAVGRELVSTPEYQRDGQAARTLLRAPDLRVVLVALRANKTILEHHAKATATVQLLSGQVRMQLPERRLELAPGQLVTLAAGAPHDVHAESDARLLLTLAWSAE